MTTIDLSAGGIPIMTLTPIDELRRLHFSISALAHFVATQPGSYEAENAQNIALGLRNRIAWVIANLEKAGEGKKNFGVPLIFEGPQ